ncbi:MAG TPA: hypothetical protein VLJ59_07010 [Mycobacteriales bacterium]|nr:hypothetical protein [Mycobacteriales bacterium]
MTQARAQERTRRLYVNRDASYTSGLDGQTARIRINAQVDAYIFDKIPNTFVTVSLDGTSVKATDAEKLATDRDDKRGWYTEWVEVQVTLDNPDFVVRQDAPQTTMGSGAVSSTTSLSIDASAGTFGPTPTTNVGAGLTIGSSVSHNLTDFKIQNRSTDQLVKHRYKLAQTSGGAYESPGDLVNMSAAGQFQGSPLFTLPDLAITNLPVLTTVIFMSTSPQQQDVNLSITVTHHLAQVEKTFKVFSVSVDNWWHEWASTATQAIPLSSL